MGSVSLEKPDLVHLVGILVPHYVRALISDPVNMLCYMTKQGICRYN